MTEATQFLDSLSELFQKARQSSGPLPAQEHLVDSAFNALGELVREDGLALAFQDANVMIQGEPLGGSRWEWGARLAEVGVREIRFDREVRKPEFEGFIRDTLARLGITPVDVTDAESLRHPHIHSGSPGAAPARTSDPPEPGPAEALPGILGEETAAVGWLHDQVRQGLILPAREAETVVRVIALSMRGDGGVFLPLIRPCTERQYMAAHAVNVCVLAMGLAEFLEMSSADVHQIGVAAILHDVGKVLVADEVLAKPGGLSSSERDAVRLHPLDGARMLLRQGQELPAIVAYEHHMRIDGSGYPARRYDRPLHPASRLIAVCDVYDALCSQRPYREPWMRDMAMKYLFAHTNSHFDPEIVVAFETMMAQWAPPVVWT
jgi:HD-GYP domain-containing protein (c-di-GMP phosphodiesterase class II)